MIEKEQQQLQQQKVEAEQEKAVTTFNKKAKLNDNQEDSPIREGYNY